MYWQPVLCRLKTLLDLSLFVCYFCYLLPQNILLLRWLTTVSTAADHWILMESMLQYHLQNYRIRTKLSSVISTECSLEEVVDILILLNFKLCQ